MISGASVRADATAACGSCTSQPEGWLVPVTGDCTQFCVCGTFQYDGAVLNQVVQTCPSGLYFNPTLRVCDWPLAAGCASAPSS